MHLGRLRTLIELNRLGSMRAVAQAMHTTTSTVSQQIAALARDTGTALVEADGRNVRLTAAGLLLAKHGVTILATVESVMHEVRGEGEPVGVLQVAGSLTALRRVVLPGLAALSVQAPRLEVLVSEHEPDDAVRLLAADLVDLAFVYDYSLAPRTWGPHYTALPVLSDPWGVAARGEKVTTAGSAGEIMRLHSEAVWLCNSRNDGDEVVIRALAAAAGFVPRFGDRCDDLGLVEDLVLSGRGVALLPVARPARAGLVCTRLTDPDLQLRTSLLLRADRIAQPRISVAMQAFGVGSPALLQ